MRVRAAFVLAGIACLAAPAAAFNWVPVGPPGNPSIAAMAVANADFSAPHFPPSLLYAATAGGSVFRSPDGGNTWSDTGPGLPGPAISLAVRQVFHMGVDTGSYDTTVFAATTNGLFRLLPGAGLWTASNSGLTTTDVFSVAVGGNGVAANANGSIVYAGTDSGLFASTDGGDTWVPKTTGLPDSGLSVYVIATDPSSPTRLYLGTALGIFKSIDAGETWSQLDPVPGFIYFTTTLTVDPLVPSRLYANGAANPPCNPGQVCPPIAFLPVSLRSLDGGATWTKMDALGMNSVHAFAATPNLPARVFAGSVSNGVFESDDGGATWTPANTGLGLASVSALVIDPVTPSFIFAGTNNGVFCSPLGQVAATCVSDTVTLCLNGHRFQATVVWRSAGGNGNGQAYPITDNTGAFWFFDPTNLDLVVKVLDGRSVNGKWWVFFGSLTNVEFTLTVTDTLTGQVRTYTNPLGQMASFADTSAF